MAIASVLLAAGCSSSSTVADERREVPDLEAFVESIPRPDDGSDVDIGPATTPTPTEVPTSPRSEPPEAPAPSATEGGQLAESEAAEPPDPEPSPFAELAGAPGLPPAPVGFDALVAADPGPVPISLTLDDIEVDDAAVIPVGVNQDETFEVPPADQVGWYRFGPSPGQDGSAVLAAHIAFDGVDGVFRNLAEIAIGSTVVVGYDDGTSRRYRVESVTDYVKEELPDELFARDGSSQLALITCGGAFNRQLQSYDSNTVVVAIPI